MLRLTEHLKRLVRSAKLYYMPVPYTRRAALRRHLRGARVQQARRLLHPAAGLPRLRRDGPEPDERAGAASSSPRGRGAPTSARRASSTACAPRRSSIQSLDHTALARAAKATGQYLNSILAKIEVLNAGYDEAVMLTEHGHVAEGSGENIFVRAQRRAHDAAAERRRARGHHPRHRHEARRERGHRAAGAQPVAQRPRHRRRALLHRHRRRGRADPRGGRPPHRRARPGDAPHAGALHGHHRGHATRSSAHYMEYARK